MSSSIDTIGHKLQTLEERLQAENESRDCMVFSQMPAPRQVPRPPQLTPTRPRKPMNLPVFAQQQTVETETVKKLKKIMTQTGILTINNIQYKTEIKDLEHLGDLGNGTSGNVVKMRHTPSGTIIAVKQMRRTSNSEENKRILMDLDVVLKSHDCQYIVQCLGCFITDPDVWICMELMSMCFDKLLKLSKKPVPEDILGKVTVATVKALSYLKEKHGVIHRDVKPSNILIDEKGNIKLCDFGISGRLVDSKAATRSAGCAAYMAPERIDPKKPKYDIRADVWSLGITLVELATSRSPYDGCKTDFEVLTKVLDSDPPSLPMDQQFSQAFRDFVNKCLTKNHHFRPKYPELLEQPFIKMYETNNVDIPGWFRSVVEKAEINTHRRNSSSTMATTVNSSSSSSTSATIARTNSFIASLKSSQIPSYQSLNKPISNLSPQSQQQCPQQQDITQDNNILTSNLINNKKSSLPQPITRANNLNQKFATSTASSVNENGFSNAPDLSNCDDVDIVSEMNKMYRKSPFVQRKFSNLPRHAESPKKESMLSSFGQSLIRNLTTSPFSQKKILTQPEGYWNIAQSPDGGGGGGIQTTSFDDYNCVQQSPYRGRQRFQNSVPVNSDAHYQRSNRGVQGNTSPIVLQRFYHQQNQLREKEREKRQINTECSTNPFLSSYVPSTINQPDLAASPPSHSKYYESPDFGAIPSPHSGLPLANNHHPNQQQQHLSGIPISRYQYLNSEKRNTAAAASDNPFKIFNESKTTNHTKQFSVNSPSTSKDNNSFKDDQGWFNSLAGVVRRQFATYVKMHLAPAGGGTSTNTPTTTGDKDISNSKSDRNQYNCNDCRNNIRTKASSTTIMTPRADFNIYESSGVGSAVGQHHKPSMIQPPSAHYLSGIDRRHRSPDPPPRFNRGQSPLLLRKNLLELSGQPSGSPLLQKRYITASPPLPPPRRGSESVPGSPQHFRTRIHYTPEPQRRIYRTIDQ